MIATECPIRPSRLTLLRLACDATSRRSTQFSASSRARSKARLAALISCASENGLSRKSDAPARSASMAVSTSANAVIRITSLLTPRSRSCFSQLTPETPGSEMSSTIRSKRCCATSGSAASTLPAVCTLPQRDSSARLMKLTMPGSSSTTSTL
ncbi:hypothetical protein D3C72_1933220 [compost metagenome]